MGGVFVRCLYPSVDTVLPNVRLDGLTILITGVSLGGIGFETSRSLVERGARVIMASRNRGKMEFAKCEIERRLKNVQSRCGTIALIELDVSDLVSIEQCVTRLGQLNIHHLNAVIHNAGILAAGGDRYLLSPQGIELTMATNYLGAFYLSDQLIPLLLAGSAHQLAHYPESPYISRLVHVTSSAHQWSTIPDAPSRIESRFQPKAEYYDVWESYANSKHCQMLHTYALSQRYDPHRELQVFSAHPGVVYTSIGHSWYFRMICCLGYTCFKTVSQGAATNVYLICQDRHELVDENGSYFDNLRPAHVAPRFRQQELVSRLWEYSMRVIREFKEERRQATSSLLPSSAVSPRAQIDPQDDIPDANDPLERHQLLASPDKLSLVHTID